MINRLGKQYKSYQNKYSKLKNEAIEEVSKAHDLLTKRLEAYSESKSPEVLKHLKKAEGYLSGEIPIYTPPHYVCAANSLASVCRTLIQQENFELLEGLVEIAYVNSLKEIDGIWQSTEVPCLKKCYFYNAISKLDKEQAEWSYESFDHSFVCWKYLQLAVKCWNLTGEDFEGCTLNHQTIEESEKSNKLLGLHGYWTELQAIRNKRDLATPFFTMKRFCKYLEVVATEILTEKKKGEPPKTSLTFDTIGLELDGEHLLLVITKGRTESKIEYLLHTFKSFLSPYLFIKNLIENFGKEFSPADFKMKSNSCPNLLDRANLKGNLRKLFLGKGQRKDSIYLKMPWIRMNEQPLETRLSIQKQVEDIDLPIYNKLETVSILNHF